MSVAARLASLERKHGGVRDECHCGGGSPKLLFCRDPSVPVPPRRRCERCGRDVPCLLVGIGPPVPGEIVAREPAYQAFGGLRDFYDGTVRNVPPYEYVPRGTLRALVCGEAARNSP